MTYRILRSDKELGWLSFDAENNPVLSSEMDGSFVDFIRVSQTEGIDMLCDIQEGSRRMQVKRKVEPTNFLFPLAMKQWLERHGYEVREFHPEVDEKIARALEKLTDPDLVRRIREALRAASYLEKTYLLEQLNSPNLS